MRPIECSFALAQGSRWWNSRRSRERQRRPFRPMNAHRPPSRATTARLIWAGMWREADPDFRADFCFRGLDVWANFFRFVSSSSSVSARPKISARSPSRIWWRSRDCASRSLSQSAWLPVNWTLKRLPPRGLGAELRARGTGAEGAASRRCPSCVSSLVSERIRTEAGLGSGELPDPRRYVWLRRPVGQEHLDRTLGPMAHQVEQLDLVLRSELGSE